MDTLSLFLREKAAQPFDWATAHCLLLGADWAVANGHSDPAAGLRFAVTNEKDALWVLAVHGGLRAMMSQKLDRLEQVSSAHAVRGDLGAVIVCGPSGRAEACGINTGRRWAVRGQRGLWIGPAEAIAVWRV